MGSGIQLKSKFPALEKMFRVNTNLLKHILKSDRMKG